MKSKKKAKTRRPARMNRLMSYLLRLPLLYCLGSVILFSSWVIQNYLGATWRSRIAELDAIQVRIDVQEILSTQWFTMWQREVRDPDGNQEVLRTCAHQYVMHRAALLTLASVRLMDLQEDQKAERVKRDVIVAKARGLLERKDTEGLTELVKSILSTEQEHGRQYLDAYYALYSAVSDRKYVARQVFLGAYVLGALVIAAAFVKQKRSVNDEKQEIG